MTLEAMEFIRHFSMHVLPKRFGRIRHYGICNSSLKQKSALVIKAQLPAPLPKLIDILKKWVHLPYNPNQCSCCKKETMQTLLSFDRRGPPGNWKELGRDLLTGNKVLPVIIVEKRKLQSGHALLCIKGKKGRLFLKNLQ